MDKPIFENRKRQLLWLAVHNREGLSMTYRRTLKRQGRPGSVFATVHEMIRAVLAKEFPTVR
jgi:hypothetical protein